MKLAILAGVLMVLGLTGILVATILRIHESYNEVEQDYGVIIDAGSTSTKAYIYEWDHKTTTYLPYVSLSMSDDHVPRMYKAKPGIASLEPNTTEVAAYLDPILDWVSSIVPEDKIDKTPIYFQGTGGLRQLDVTSQGALLTSVRFKLQDTGFLFDSTYASILSGTQEAGYGFLAVNGLYGNFNFEEEFADNLYGSLDMGGVTSSIAFVSPDHPPENYTFQTEINGTTFTTYAQAIDGLGLNEARYAFNESLYNASYTNVVDPCVPSGYIENTTIEINGELRSFILTGSSNYELCRSQVENLVRQRTANLPIPPVGTITFILSDHYLDVKKFFHLKDNANLLELQAIASSFCTLDYGDAMAHHSNFADDVQNYCFIGNYVVTLLRDFYGFDTAKRHLLWKDVRKTPVTWTLGSMMEIVDNLEPDTSDQTKTRLVRFYKTTGGIFVLFISCLILVLGIVLFILQRRRPSDYVPIR